MAPALPSPTIERNLTAQPWDDLIPHLLKVGADVEPTIERIRRFTRLLFEWNRGASNLISRNDEPRFLARHVLESIEPAHWLAESAATDFVDLGSGGGLPALPLALAGVGKRWTLVESRRSKTLFLRKAIQELALSHVQVIHARAEDIVAAGEHAGQFDAFTSRATMTLGPTLVLAANLVKPMGRAFLWKGSRREEEMRTETAWQSAWELDGLLGIGQGPTVVSRFTRKMDQ